MAGSLADPGGRLDDACPVAGDTAPWQPIARTAMTMVLRMKWSLANEASISTVMTSDWNLLIDDRTRACRGA